MTHETPVTFSDVRWWPSPCPARQCALGKMAQFGRFFRVRADCFIALIIYA
jgi:hypothetical protein